MAKHMASSDITSNSCEEKICFFSVVSVAKFVCGKVRAFVQEKGQEKLR